MNESIDIRLTIDELAALVVVVGLYSIYGLQLDAQVAGL